MFRQFSLGAGIVKNESMWVCSVESKAYEWRNLLRLRCARATLAMFTPGSLAAISAGSGMGMWRFQHNLLVRYGLMFDVVARLKIERRPL